MERSTSTPALGLPETGSRLASLAAGLGELEGGRLLYHEDGLALADQPLAGQHDRAGAGLGRVTAFVGGVDELAQLADLERLLGVGFEDVEYRAVEAAAGAARLGRPGRLLRPIRCSRVGVGMMHCRRADFETLGGFDETIYAAEDVQLAYDLKKIGKPRGQKFNLIHKGWIITSTRKIDQTPLFTMLAKLIGFGFGLQKKIRSKEYCEHWYDKAAR